MEKRRTAGFQFILLVLLLILLCPGISSAINSEQALALSRESGNLRLGPFDVHPYASLKEYYSDNIYYTRDDKKSDYITSFQPGIILQLPLRQHLLSFDVSTVLNGYARHSSENTTDFNASGLANFMFGSLITLNVSDAYTKGHEPRSDSATGNIEKYRTNAASASLTYKLAEVSKVQLDYTRTAWTYLTSEFRSRNEDLVSAYVYYRMLPKTSAFVEYDFKNVNFDQSNELNNKVNTAQIGATWEITQKSKGTLKGGYLWKNFDQTSEGKVKTWIGSLDLNHQFSDYTSLYMVGSRSVNESNLLDTRYFITTGLYGEVTHKFIDRLAGVVKGSYSENRYSDIIPGDTILRKDKVALGGVGMKYLFTRRLELTLEYNYRKKDSNIDKYDWTENLYLFMANFSL